MEHTKIHLESKGEEQTIDIMGSHYGVLKTLCLAFEKQPMVKELFKDALKVHDKIESISKQNESLN